MIFWSFLRLCLALLTFNSPLSGVYQVKQAQATYKMNDYDFETNQFSKSLSNTIDYQKTAPIYNDPDIRNLLRAELYEWSERWELPAEDVTLARSELYDSVLEFHFHLFWQAIDKDLTIEDEVMTINLANFRGHVILTSPHMQWPVPCEGQKIYYWHQMDFTFTDNYLNVHHEIRGNGSPPNHVSRILIMGKHGLKYIQLLINQMKIIHSLPKFINDLKDFRLPLTYDVLHFNEIDFGTNLTNTFRETNIFLQNDWLSYFAMPTLSIANKQDLKKLNIDGKLLLKIPLLLQKNVNLTFLNYYLPTLNLTIDVRQTFKLNDLIKEPLVIEYEENDDWETLLFDKLKDNEDLIKNHCELIKKDEEIIIKALPTETWINGELKVKFQPKTNDITKFKKPLLKILNFQIAWKDWSIINQTIFDDWQKANNLLKNYQLSDFVFEWNKTIPQIGHFQLMIKPQSDQRHLIGSLSVKFELKANPNDNDNVAKDDSTKKLSWWWFIAPIILLALIVGVVYWLNKRKRAKSTD